MCERIDDTGFGGIKVIQKHGLGYGVDSVLLASFAAGETGASGIRAGTTIADLGSGSGIIGFILCHKISDIHVVGIEKRANAVDRAKRAAELNRLEDRIEFIQADVTDYRSDRKFDAVVSNPPYFRQAAAVPSATDDKFIARHETSANINDFAATASSLLSAGGDFWLVHRPDRLADIFQALRCNNIEPKEMQMVAPKAGEAANIVLIHGVKNAGKELRILPEIVVHTEDGGYTDLIERLYERR